MGGVKFFDSHSRDLLVMGHPFGTRTLIEIDSLGTLSMLDDYDKMT